jgi:hypothetical protein
MTVRLKTLEMRGIIPIPILGRDSFLIRALFNLVPGAPSVKPQFYQLPFETFLTIN